MTIADLGNEHALLFEAVTNFVAYRALAIDLEDYTDEFARLAVRLAEQTFEEHGQLPPTEAALRVFNTARDHKLVPPDRLDTFFALVMDPPLGVLPDPAKLKYHRDLRNLGDTLRTGLLAVQRGDAERARAALENAREQASRRLYEAVRCHSPSQLADLWRTEVERLASNDGISVGLPKLKTAVGQLSPGMVIVVGGATGVGKSSLALEMALAAPKDGTKSGLISVEDTLFTTTTRILAGLSGATARALHHGREVALAERAIAEFRELDGGFYMSECIGGTEQDVIACMAVMAQQGVRLVVVDYIGEIEASVRQQDRRNEIRWLMKRLKTAALRLGMALVIVSQLGRPKDKEPSHKPTKYDLKEAGDLENSAEYIVLLWREKEHDYEPVHVELAKSKVGGTGMHWLMQREVYTEDRYGTRRPGSARMREVVEETDTSFEARTFPSVRRDYVALLETIR